MGQDNEINEDLWKANSNGFKYLCNINNTLSIDLDVLNVFWHCSGGTMQFENEDLKTKNVGLCHNNYKMNLHYQSLKFTKMTTYQHQ